MGHRQRHDAHVDLPVAQPLEQLFGLMFVEHQPEMRQRLANLLHDPRQQIGAYGGNQSHFKLAGERIGVVAREGDDFVAFVEHAARAHHHLPADLRELHVLRLPLDQFDAQEFFSFFSWADRVGWLTNVRSAALPKWPVSASATRYLRSLRFTGVMVSGIGDIADRYSLSNK